MAKKKGIKKEARGNGHKTLLDLLPETESIEKYAYTDDELLDPAVISLFCTSIDNKINFLDRKYSLKVKQQDSTCALDDAVDFLKGIPLKHNNLGDEWLCDTMNEIPALIRLARDWQKAGVCPDSTLVLFLIRVFKERITRYQEKYKWTFSADETGIEQTEGGRP